VYREDLIERALELLKFYALANVGAFHDARLAAAHRPRLLSAGGAPNLASFQCSCGPRLLINCMCQ
jgi:hypothetical protein